jgi:hypothetical protein
MSRKSRQFCHSGKTVAQGMDGTSFLNPGSVFDIEKHPFHGALLQRLYRKMSLKQVGGRAITLPIFAQQFEQLRRKQRIAILVAIALDHAQHHARAVRASGGARG